MAARLLRSWVRIPPGAWIFVCCECRVSSGRGLCDKLITRPEESYRLCCVVVCDLETSRMGAPYIYDISRLRVKLTIRVQTAPPSLRYVDLYFLPSSTPAWRVIQKHLYLSYLASIFQRTVVSLVKQTSQTVLQ